MSQSEAPLEISQQILSWYRLYKRSLPWRDRQHDPYAVWVSEIMLQQTTVNAVVGFYNRWMERFPTLESLAEAPLDDVLKQWAGLGYYARARNLKSAAELVVERFNGKLPRTAKSLMSLPGVGRYTAGAISSICFGEDEPVVDANVIRVLCRIFALHGDPKSSTKLQNELWAIAGELLPKGEASDFNQGLMELGALICSPESPDCAQCPVMQSCQATKLGDPTAFPESGAAKMWIEVTHVACVVHHNGRILIVQRPLNQLWGGLWELPRTAIAPGETELGAAARAVRDTVGIEVIAQSEFARHRHVVTNRKVTLIGCDSTWDECGSLSAIGCTQYKWVTLEEIRTYAVSSPQIELLDRYKSRMGQPTLSI